MKLKPLEESPVYAHVVVVMQMNHEGFDGLYSYTHSTKSDAVAAAKDEASKDASRADGFHVAAVLVSDSPIKAIL